ncbi:16S rRNA (cytidine(1402)-2'-O)-methyltransferase [Paucibacter sp. DJ2R-2]|uniref:16S rRNA (cytidine(1402)-2'-O)-methyltransferase n=1 Tax=Paucibacter sp. DJ2R-2 TaxID=2893558 RepID=UPI0021E37B40|nr:16S rRNA (cytidine(1402)-2'-O)-methyltransferase [Paucibacter sp. DJ2R-2]MCV2421950.1 16S rRNA (cytidine(1402)-2'-O)-methyltransferase [Paucibacter sp. DJ4R-1]MCV2439433.1 16S rRNA (cytidine(1402)-2'-O)-methyltransferase [Paucibacter sp. DJ2R-2]
MNIDASLLLQAAAAAAGGQQYPAATLYVVATPIGNLADISLRAVHVLGLVDAVACEDTRVSAGLLRHLGLHKPLIKLHQHNEHEASADLLARLRQGERIAYISDAGTPAISDPGAVLVAAVAAAGLRVLPLPGASSTVTALSVAGDTAAEGFEFAGFLPTKTAERRNALQALTGSRRSQVLFEAPHRIEALLALLAELCPEQTVTVCRELTKQFETVYTAPAASLPAWLAADAQRERGEFVLVLHAVRASQAAADDLPAETLRTLDLLLRELPLKQAVSLAAELSGASRNRLYDLALEKKNKAQD